MADAQLWEMTHGQRRDLADLLAGLTPDQWQAASLCEGWQVRDVVAHMIATARMTPGRFFGQFAAAGFRFPVFTARGIARCADLTPEQLVAQVRETATLTGAPPGPPVTPLSEVVVHSLDISHPLGIKRDIPAPVLVRVLDFYRRTQALIGARKRIEGMRLRATDVDWHTGEGPEVAGPAGSLLLATAGRRPALDDLTGPGAALLAERM